MKKLFILCGVVWLLTSCQGSGDGAAAQGEPKQRPVHLVDVLKVRPEVVAPLRERSGTLTAERILKVVAREEGVLLELPHHPGDLVAAGTRLYRIDDALLRSGLTRAEANLSEAQQTLHRMRRLRADKAVSEEQLISAETAEAVARAEVESLRLRIGYTHLAAPFDAVVSERLAEPGEFVSARTPLLTLLDPKALVTEVPISELLLAHLGLGDEVQVQIEALGESHYSGSIVRIHPQIDPLSRQGRVEIRLDPPPPGARPGQLARVSFRVRSQPRLMVPFAALRSDPEGEYLYLYQDGKAQRRRVRSGAAVGQRVSILEGLEADDLVIVRGLLDLRNGKAVEISQSSTQGDGA